MTKFEEEFKSLFEEHYGSYVGITSELVNKISEKFAVWKPQPAPPVVKDFVAEWYEKHKDDLDFSIFEACVSLYDDNSSDFKKWFGNSENKSIETLVRMKDGYQVEKPQLFYSKNKMTGDCLAICLARASSGLYVEVTEKWLTRKEQTSYKLYFTQQEIDSMQTGSYELVPVEDGE